MPSISKEQQRKILISSIEAATHQSFSNLFNDMLTSKDVETLVLSFSKEFSYKIGTIIADNFI